MIYTTLVWMLQKRYLFARGLDQLQSSSSSYWEKLPGRRHVTLAPPAGYFLKNIFLIFFPFMTPQWLPTADPKTSKMSGIQGLIWSNTNLFSGFISWHFLHRYFVPLHSISSEFSSSSISNPAVTKWNKQEENHRAVEGVQGQNLRSLFVVIGVSRYPQ